MLEHDLSSYGAAAAEGGVGGLSSAMRSLGAEPLRPHLAPRGIAAGSGDLASDSRDLLSSGAAAGGNGSGAVELVPFSPRPGLVMDSSLIGMGLMLDPVTGLVYAELHPNPSAAAAADAAAFIHSPSARGSSMPPQQQQRGSGGSGGASSYPRPYPELIGKLRQPQAGGGGGGSSHSASVLLPSRPSDLIHGLFQILSSLASDPYRLSTLYKLREGGGGGGDHAAAAAGASGGWGGGGLDARAMHSMLTSEAPPDVAGVISMSDADLVCVAIDSDGDGRVTLSDIQNATCTSVSRPDVTRGEESLWACLHRISVALGQPHPTLNQAQSAHKPLALAAFVPSSGTSASRGYWSAAKRLSAANGGFLSLFDVTSVLSEAIPGLSRRNVDISSAYVSALVFSDHSAANSSAASSWGPPTTTPHELLQLLRAVPMVFSPPSSSSRQQAAAASLYGRGSGGNNGGGSGGVVMNFSPGFETETASASTRRATIKSLLGAGAGGVLDPYRHLPIAQPLEAINGPNGRLVSSAFIPSPPPIRDPLAPYSSPQRMIDAMQQPQLLMGGGSPSGGRLSPAQQTASRQWQPQDPASFVHLSQGRYPPTLAQQHMEDEKERERLKRESEEIQDLLQFQQRRSQQQQQWLPQNRGYIPSSSGGGGGGAGGGGSSPPPQLQPLAPWMPPPPSSPPPHPDSLHPGAMGPNAYSSPSSPPHPSSPNQAKLNGMDPSRSYPNSPPLQYQLQYPPQPTSPGQYPPSPDRQWVPGLSQNTRNNAYTNNSGGPGGGALHSQQYQETTLFTSSPSSYPKIPDPKQTASGGVVQLTSPPPQHPSMTAQRYPSVTDHDKQQQQQVYRQLYSGTAASGASLMRQTGTGFASAAAAAAGGTQGAVGGGGMMPLDLPRGSVASPLMHSQTAPNAQYPSIPDPRGASLVQQTLIPEYGPMGGGYPKGGRYPSVYDRDGTKGGLQRPLSGSSTLFPSDLRSGRHAAGDRSGTAAHGGVGGDMGPLRSALEARASGPTPPPPPPAFSPGSRASYGLHASSELQPEGGRAGVQQHMQPQWPAPPPDLDLYLRPASSSNPSSHAPRGMAPAYQGMPSSHVGLEAELRGVSKSRLGLEAELRGGGSKSRPMGLEAEVMEDDRRKMAAGMGNGNMRQPKKFGLDAEM